MELLYRLLDRLDTGFTAGLLAACSSKSPTSLPPESPVLPRLPAEARQESTLPFRESANCVATLEKSMSNVTRLRHALPINIMVG
ncbi:hypothetical protein [Pseudomonas sp. LB3P38]|uniref:hypothetical protein n=1 Tax=Pseudomonas lyxosi TaxID=3398358 RepID=UPI0039F13392